MTLNEWMKKFNQMGTSRQYTVLPLSIKESVRHHAENSDVETFKVEVAKLLRQYEGQNVTVSGANGASNPSSMRALYLTIGTIEGEIPPHPTKEPEGVKEDAAGTEATSK